MENLEIHNAIAGIFGFIQDCNKYINDNKPWEVKDKNKLNYILYNLADAIRIIAMLIQPFIPETSEKINKQLNLELETFDKCKAGLLEYTKITRQQDVCLQRARNDTLRKRL